MICLTRGVKIALLVLLWMPYCSLFGQAIPPAERLVTMNVKHATYAVIFTSIWEQTRLQAFYNDEQLPSSDTISINVADEPLANVLTYLLRGRNLTWYYREETFVILPKKVGDKDQGVMPKPPGIKVQGQVIDDGNEPLVNVSILLDGTKNGTITDADGHFELKNVPAWSSLTIRYVGYKNKNVKISTSFMLLRLEPANEGLDEVVVLGYGKTSRRKLTGSISKISGEEIGKLPVSNPIASMQGRITGLNIISLNGMPGANFRIELRGRNSIGSGNVPLFYIDNVPVNPNPLSWDNNNFQGTSYQTPIADGLGANRSANPLNINPSDVASIEVLKDADATAIYGSRGANGVILITTKLGTRSAKPQGILKVNKGIGVVGHMVNYLDTRQYLSMRHEAFRNDGVLPADYDYDITGVWDTLQYTDWQQKFIGGTAGITDLYGSVSGGNLNTQYFISGGFREEKPVYPDDFRYLKGGGRINLSNATPNKKWRTTINAAYNSDNNYLPAFDLTEYVTTPPNAPAGYLPDGSLNWAKGYDNPSAALMRKYKASSENLIVSGVTGYLILPGLELKSNFGYNRIFMKEVQTSPRASYHPDYNTQFGSSQFANADVKNWLIEPQLVVDKRIGAGVLMGTVGYSVQREQRNQLLLEGTLYKYDSLLENKADAGKLIPKGEVNNDYQFSSWFGRLNYNIGDKYIINFTGRIDGSNRFPPGRRSGIFGAVGSAWIFSEEKFISKHLNWISFGKLRASYGIIGNDQLKDYRKSTLARTGNYGWEKVKKQEIGLELGLFKDKIFITQSYYHSITSDLLMEEEIISPNDTIYQVKNMDARVRNQGYELEVTVLALNRNGVKWTTGFNLTIPRNKLLSFPQIARNAYNYYYTVGQPLDIYKGFHCIGVDPVTGLYLFEDRNGDGKITQGPVTGDQTYSKKTGASLFGGFTSKITYKGFTLDVLLQFVKQTGYDYRFNNLSPGPGIAINQPVTVLDRWQQPGDTKPIQGYGQAYTTDRAIAFNQAVQSDLVIGDASYLRLKSLYFSTEMPDRLRARLKIRSGSRLFISGQNIITITNFKGRDPETSISNFNVYPPLRIWNIGIQINL